MCGFGRIWTYGQTDLVQHTPGAIVSTVASLKVIPKLCSLEHRDRQVFHKHYQTESISTVKSFFEYRGLILLLSYK